MLILLKTSTLHFPTYTLTTSVTLSLIQHFLVYSSLNNFCLYFTSLPKNPLLREGFSWSKTKLGSPVTHTQHVVALLHST